jgi:hypothetical protein
MKCEILIRARHARVTMAPQSKNSYGGGGGSRNALTSYV